MNQRPFVIGLLGIFAMLSAGAGDCSCSLFESDCPSRCEYVTGDTATLDTSRPTIFIQTEPAKKECHAGFVVLYWWNDSTMASEESSPAPEIQVSAQSTGGVLALPTDSTKSWNEYSNRWEWRIAVDRGAKNDPDPDTIYQLTVLSSESSLAVDVDLAITYIAAIESRCREAEGCSIGRYPARR